MQIQMPFPFEKPVSFAVKQVASPLQARISSEAFVVFFPPGCGALFALGMLERREKGFVKRLFAFGASFGGDLVRQFQPPAEDVSRCNSRPCSRGDQKLFELCR